jgi:lipopolysaccharide/colanic/teichoic acid biosynthesis glycosyltransferase
VTLQDLHLARQATAGGRLARAAKRGVDVLGAALLLCLLAPLLAVIALTIKATSPGPVLFRQTRLGRGCVPFSILKFRTMVIDAERQLAADPAAVARYLQSGYKLPPGGETRTNRVGRWLRRAALDELPQLVNVLVGHMSLVGPRPVIEPEILEYGDCRWAYEATRPGMSGAWQVHGRGRIVYPERAHLDARYVAHWSLWSDLKILVLTVPAIVRGEGEPTVMPVLVAAGQ